MFSCLCACGHNEISHWFVVFAAPPSYRDLAISESHRRECLQDYDRSDGEGEDQGSLLTYITEFRYLPPPLYSEVQSVLNSAALQHVYLPFYFPAQRVRVGSLYKQQLVVIYITTLVLLRYNYYTSITALLHEYNCVITRQVVVGALTPKTVSSRQRVFCVFVSFVQLLTENSSVTFNSEVRTECPDWSITLDLCCVCVRRSVGS